VRGHLRRQDLGLSIIAGTPLQLLADGMAHAAFVRAMPNTPGQIGHGVTVVTPVCQGFETQV
jgi:pyrroline-5-carboxylate reductase